MTLRIETDDTRGLTLVHQPPRWVVAFFGALAIAFPILFWPLVGVDRLTCREGACEASVSRGFSAPVVARFKADALHSPEVKTTRRKTESYQLAFQVRGYGPITFAAASWGDWEAADGGVQAIRAYLAGTSPTLDVTVDNRPMAYMVLAPAEAIFLWLIVLGLCTLRSRFERGAQTVTVERRWPGGYARRRVLPLEGVEVVRSAYKGTHSLALKQGKRSFGLGGSSDPATTDALHARLEAWLAENRKEMTA